MFACCFYIGFWKQIPPNTSRSDPVCCSGITLCHFSSAFQLLKANPDASVVPTAYRQPSGLRPSPMRLLREQHTAAGSQTQPHQMNPTPPPPSCGNISFFLLIEIYIEPQLSSHGRDSAKMTSLQLASSEAVSIRELRSRVRIALYHPAQVANRIHFGIYESKESGAAGMQVSY